MFSNRTLLQTRSAGALLLTLVTALVMLRTLSEVFHSAQALSITPYQMKGTQPQVLTSTHVVTNADDDGFGSLRQAIADADTGDVITFDNNYTIYLSSTLTLTKELTIDGSSFAVTLSGDTNNDDSRNVRVFFITSTAVVTFNHLNIISGTAFSDGYLGGGVYVNPGSRLTVEDSTFAGNIGEGGGIYNGGVTTVTNSIFMSNTAASVGAGIYNMGDLAVLECAFTGNVSQGNGGGIYTGGRLTLSRGTFTGNFADSNGGGMAGYGTFTVTNSLLVSNTANSEGGGIFVDGNGNLVVQDSTLSKNFAGYAGGGIENLSNLVLANSTLAENIAAYTGGGLYNYGSFTATNSTFSGNSAKGSDAQYEGGGAIDQWGPANTPPTALLENVTFANNSAPNVTARDGIWLERGSMVLRNVLLAGNGLANCAIKAGATLTATIDSMADDSTCAGATPVASMSLTLSPLDDNGGSTRTHALLPGNPAINAGNDAECPPTDQRGVIRPQGSHCDIGAYEFQEVSKYVAPPPSGNDANDCDSATAPCATIGAAIGKASASETINIAAGTFAENLTISKPLNFVGAGESNTIIDGNLAGRVFNIPGGMVSIANLTIQNGSISGDGGGIYNIGNLTLNHVIVMSNTASNFGGGIYNAGTLLARDSMIHFNAADNSGCGLYNIGTAEFLSTPILNNYAPMPIGGGIYNSGWLRIISSTVANNSGMANGNILNNGGTLFFIKSSISGGSSTTPGNAIASYNNGQAFLTDSLIIDTPGAIETVNSTLVITNSVIMSNVSAYSGSGINAVKSTVFITNSTVSGNVANSGRGGGLFINTSVVQLDNVTIANNTANAGASGGGLYIASGVVSARNTIIAGNHDTGVGPYHPDCSGVLTSQGHNLIGDAEGCTISGTLTGLITNTMPLLGELQDNGGSTWTHALLPGSPAIDAGNDAACPPTDQRGVIRPQGAHCDIGAYERPYSHFLYLPLLHK